MKKYVLFLLLGLVSQLALAQSNTAPTTLAATAKSSTRIDLTWKEDITGEAGFEIERSTDNRSFTKIGDAAANATSFQNTGLSPSTRYYYRVRAIVRGTGSAYSNTADATTLAAPPVANDLKANAKSTTSIELTWTASGKEPLFSIERRTGQSGRFERVGGGSGSYTDNNLQPGTEYCYRVQFAEGTETAPYSNIACATTQQSSPSAPARLSVQAVSPSQINLQWADVSGNETGFQVERASSPTASFTKIADLPANSTTYSDLSLSAGTQYCYRVRAINGAGASGYSSVECATTQTPVPGVPTNVVATAVSPTQINLTWTAPNAKEGDFYEVQRAGSPGGSYQTLGNAQVGANGAGSYASQNLSPNTQYCYRVRRYSAPQSDFGNEACATTQTPPVITPEPPTNLVASAASTSQINLSWTATTSTFGTGYQVERATSPGGGYSVIADLGNVTSYSNTGLSPNTQYCYRVRTKYNSILSNPGNEACATTPAPPVTIPRPPGNLAATAASPSQINLTWTDNADNESGFDLERSTDGTNFTKVADSGANATAYSDQGLQPRTTYYYRIRAKNTAGNSPYSNVANATTPDAPPATPARLTATATSPNQINLQWADVSDNETGFQLEQSLDGNNWTKIADLPANTTSYQNTGLNPSTRYYYRIRAINAVGASAYANLADATTQDKPLTPPAAPTRLSAVAATANQINLNWADLSDNESGFEIERSPDGTNWTKTGDAPANATSFQNTGLTPNTRYYYRVRATNVAGQSAYSNTADATTPDVAPAAPARLTATPASAVVIALSWADLSANETGFEIERGTSETGAFTKVADVAANVTTYEDRGLTPAVQYCYRVRAKNTIGASAYSNVACATTPDVPPGAPARLTALPASPTQINLAWADGSTNESRFEVERGSSATGTFAKIADLPVNTTTYEDKNLTDNIAYCYRVRAVNAAGASAYTDVACATTPLAPPAAPTNLAAQVSDYDQIRLTWPPVSGKAETVIIERSTDPITGFMQIGQQPAAQTGYVDAGLQEFTTYYYRIRATNLAGNSTYSNVANARVEEVIIAVEDELSTHTTLFTNQQALHIITNWYQPMQTTVRLLTSTGQLVLTDSRKVNPADAWSYALDRLPSGMYILALVADGRSLTKRILLP
ncbi:fibronectin type III domain-containing protein [Spirosoma areae]